MKKPLVVTIVRSEWVRGKEAVETGSALLLSNGKKCCLGFACLALGVTQGQIDGVGIPVILSAEVVIPAWLRREAPASDVRKLVGTNDSSRTSDAARERRIKRIFSRHNLKAVFV